MLSLQLLNAKVLIKKEEKETTTKSGILLAEGKQEEKVRQGEVVAVGNGKRDDNGKRIPLDVVIGERVMYEYSGYKTQEVDIDGVSYHLVNEEDIIGIMK